MTIASLIFGFPSLTLIATVQSLIAIKLFLNYYTSMNYLSLIAAIFLINYAFGAIFWAFLYPFFFSPFRHLPGPRTFFSAAYRSLTIKEGPSGDLFLDMTRQHPGQELIALDLLGHQLLVASPRLFADLLIHRCYDFAKPSRISSFLRHILGGGLIITERNEHKFLHKNAMPAFHFRHINELYPMMWTKARILTATLRNEIDSGGIAGSKNSSVVELTTWASKVTLDIIGIADLGRVLNVVEKGSDPLQDLYVELLEPTREKLVFAMLSIAVGFSHETTASALTWASYLLAKHPKLQTTLREEVTAALPANPIDDPPADLAGLLRQLPYLNGIIQETLRLYPTVPMTMREARDTQIGKQFIPKGTIMVVSIWMINRSPDIWGPEAEEFYPGRWITDDGKPNQNGGTSSNYDFLTFLHGPRSCIGQEFAKAEMRCLLAAMVTSFTWDLAMDDAKVMSRAVITIKPENGMYLRLTPLDYKA
ncbi:hypothetical protein B7463_g2146, partial [Scytalidium lignicola]